MQPPPDGKARAALAGLACCALAPGVLMLAAIDAETAGTAPNWLLALGGSLFALFGLMLFCIALVSRPGRWRNIGFAAMLLAVPLTALLLAWPVAQIAVPLGDHEFAPGDLPQVARIVFGFASVLFAIASLVLWSLFVTGRVRPSDLRGMTE